jgi:hypothetical protein
MADGAYYLAGYAVECALKACIAKETKRYEFPDKKRVDSSYSHNLDLLVKARRPGRQPARLTLVDESGVSKALGRAAILVGGEQVSAASATKPLHLWQQLATAFMG